MTIPEILIWETTNVLLLIPVVIALVILTRWTRSLPLFTDRDWRFLFGQPREKVFSLKLWVSFAALWFAVTVVAFFWRAHSLGSLGRPTFLVFLGSFTAPEFLNDCCPYSQLR